MRSETFTCDTCGVEVTGRKPQWVHLTVNTSFGANIKNDYCPDCFQAMLDGLQKRRRATPQAKEKP